MQTHVRALAILHIVFGSIGVLLGSAAFLLFSGIAGVVGVSAPDRDAFLAVPILAIVGFLALILLLALSLPGIIGGVALLNNRPWGRVLLIVLSALYLFNVPFGTALGVYGFWVLLSPEVSAAFTPPRRYA